MDEQQKHSETTRPVPPASQPSSRGGPTGTSTPPPGMVKRHRGRHIALIVAALVILGVVLWRWHPWGGPGGGASGAAGASDASGARAG
ncbi:multidrug transporter subunit MdtA, partial [Paraburkholderia dipogonis]